MDLTPAGRPPRINEHVIYHIAPGVRALGQVVETFAGWKVALQLVAAAGATFVPMAAHGHATGQWSHPAEPTAPAADPGRGRRGGAPGPSGGHPGGGNRR